MTLDIWQKYVRQRNAAALLYSSQQLPLADRTYPRGSILVVYVSIDPDTRAALTKGCGCHSKKIKNKQTSASIT